VTEKQSEQIVLVQKVGDLKLVLRGEVYDDESEEVADFETLFPGIGGSPTPKRPSFGSQTKEPKQTKSIGFQMKVWQGLESEVHNFDKDGNPHSSTGGSGKKSSGGSDKKNVSFEGEGSETKEYAEELGEEFEGLDDFDEDSYLGID